MLSLRQKMWRVSAGARTAESCDFAQLWLGLPRFEGAASWLTEAGRRERVSMVCQFFPPPNVGRAWAVRSAVAKYLEVSCITFEQPPCPCPVVPRLKSSFLRLTVNVTTWKRLQWCIDNYCVSSFALTVHLPFCSSRPWCSSFFTLLCRFTHCVSRLLLRVVRSEWDVVRGSQSWESDFQVKSKARQGQEGPPFVASVDYG